MWVAARLDKHAPPAGFEVGDQVMCGKRYYKNTSSSALYLERYTCTNMLNRTVSCMSSKVILVLVQHYAI